MAHAPATGVSNIFCTLAKLCCSSSSLRVRISITVDGDSSGQPALDLFSRGLTTLSDFLSTYKRMQVLLDVNLAGMSEEDCSQENGNVSQFNQNALEHLDGTLYL